MLTTDPPPTPQAEPARPWSIDRLGRTLHISPGNGTRRIEAVTVWTIVVMVRPLARLREDRAARSIAERVIDLGRLAESDPPTFKAWVRDLLALARSDPDGLARWLEATADKLGLRWVRQVLAAPDAGPPAP